MRNHFTELMILPGGAANYDITAATAGITQMITALEALSELRCGRGCTYRLIGKVEVTNTEIEGGPSPSGQVGYLRSYKFVIGGATATTDNTAITALMNKDGEPVNIYLYDPYTETTALVEQGLNGLLHIERNTTSLKVPAWNVEVELLYPGADTRKQLPHTYS